MRTRFAALSAVLFLATVGGARAEAEVDLQSILAIDSSASITAAFRDGGSSAAFARTIERWPRRVEGGTGIGSAIFTGVKMLEASGYISPRQIIDLSGDGRETTMREFRITPSLARNMTAGRGITVNGLAILDDEPDLDTYYRHEVIGGPGAFVEIAGTIDDFARAMRVKLLREIEHRPVVGQLAAPPAS